MLMLIKHKQNDCDLKDFEHGMIIEVQTYRAINCYKDA